MAITQTQVADAYEALKSAGEKPTVRAVQSKLGTGSTATVLKYIKTHELSQGLIKPDVQALDLTKLPPELEALLATEREKMLAAVKAEREKNLEWLQAEIDKISAMKGQLDELAYKDQSHEGALIVRENEIERQNKRIKELESELREALDGAGRYRELLPMYKRILARSERADEALIMMRDGSGYDKAADYLSLDPQAG